MQCASQKNARGAGEARLAHRNLGGRPQLPRRQHQLHVEPELGARRKADHHHRELARRQLTPGHTQMQRLSLIPGAQNMHVACIASILVKPPAICRGSCCHLCSSLHQPRRRMKRASQQAAETSAPVDEHDVLADVVCARQRPRRCIVRPLHHPAGQAPPLSRSHEGRRCWAAATFLRDAWYVATAGTAASPACWHGGEPTHGRDNGDRASHSCSAGRPLLSARALQCRLHNWLPGCCVQPALNHVWPPSRSGHPAGAAPCCINRSPALLSIIDESFCPTGRLRQLRGVRCLQRARRAAAGPLYLPAVLQRVCNISLLQAPAGSRSNSRTLRTAAGGVAAVRCHPAQCATPCTPCAV